MSKNDDCLNHSGIFTRSMKKHNINKKKKKVKFRDKTTNDTDKNPLSDSHYDSDLSEELSDDFSDFIVETDEYSSPPVSSSSSDIDYEEEILNNYIEAKYNLKSIKEISTKPIDLKNKHYKNKNKDESSKETYLEKLTPEERDTINNMEEKINKINNCIIPLRYRILKKDIDIDTKATIIRQLDSLKDIDETSTDYNKIKQYIDTIIDIPFGIYKNIELVKTAKQSNINSFIILSNKILNNAIYGHDKAKKEILQYLSQIISNPKCNGNIMGIYGPAGIGKTTLIKDGISKVLKRPFFFISLGGCSDASYLDGHCYTYEGSKAGHIVEILKKAQCMNPIIYFDELDKISDTSKGEEISNLLIHITDDSQNNHFQDKYLNGIDIDLSKIFFVFSFNDIDKISPILRDRINVLELKDFNSDEKIIIATEFLIPTILNDFKIKNNMILFDNDILEYIYNRYTEKDYNTGVRKFKQILKKIISKLNMILITKSNEEIVKILNIKTQEIIFPIKVTQKLVNELLKDDSNNQISDLTTSMYT